MATRKRKPWSADLVIPGITPGVPPSPPPKPMAFSGQLGHSTPGAPAEEWECLLCEQLAAGVATSVPEHALRCPKRNPAVKS